MGRAAAGEMVPLDDAGEALALARPDDVDRLADLEDVDEDLVAFLDGGGVGTAELAELS